MDQKSTILILSEQKEVCKQGSGIKLILRGFMTNKDLFIL